jgi:hypothetical protein
LFKSFSSNTKNMGESDSNEQKNVGDNLSGFGNFPKPIWVRCIGVRTDEINQWLLEYNARALLLFGPILWIIFHIF